MTLGPYQPVHVFTWTISSPAYHKIQRGRRIIRDVLLKNRSYPLHNIASLYGVNPAHNFYVREDFPRGYPTPQTFVGILRYKPILIQEITLLGDNNPVLLL